MHFTHGGPQNGIVFWTESFSKYSKSSFITVLIFILIIHYVHSTISQPLLVIFLWGYNLKKARIFHHFEKYKFFTSSRWRDKCCCQDWTRCGKVLISKCSERSGEFFLHTSWTRSKHPSSHIHHPTRVLLTSSFLIQRQAKHLAQSGVISLFEIMQSEFMCLTWRVPRL